MTEKSQEEKRQLVEQAKEYHRRMRRRELLGAMGTGAATAFAGCGGGGEGTPTEGGDGGGDGDGDGDGGGDDDVTIDGPRLRVARAKEFDPTSAAQLNPFNPTSQSTKVNQALFPVPADYSRHNGEIIQMWSTGWEQDGKSFRISLSDEYHWNDDDLTPVTADDYLTRLHLERYYDNNVWGNRITEAKKVDDYTVELTLVDPNLRFDLWHADLYTWQRGWPLPKWVFGEYLETFRDIQPNYMPADEASDELTGALSDLVEFAWQPDIANEEGPDYYSFGPYEITDVASDVWVLSKRSEGHPALDELEYEEFHMQVTASNLYGFQSALQDESDLGTFGPSNLYNEVRNRDDTQTTHFALPNAIGIHFDPTPDSRWHDGPEGSRVFADTEETIQLRKAVAHILTPDIRNEMGKNRGGPLGYGLGTDCGVFVSEFNEAVRNLEDVFPENADGFTRYGDTERGISMLEDLGYSLEDGQLYTPEGDPFTIDMQFPSFRGDSARAIPTEIDASTPISSELSYKDGTEHENMVSPENSEKWPVDAVRATAQRSLTLFNGLQSSWMMSQWWWGFEEPEITTVEVPGTIGDPDSAKEEIDVGALLDEMPTAQDERNNEIGLKLSWAFNQYIPHIFCFNTTHYHAANEKHFEWPDPDWPQWGSKHTATGHHYYGEPKYQDRHR